MAYILRVWLYGSPVLYYADEMPEQYRFLLAGFVFFVSREREFAVRL